jgi:hypothetical protein
MDELKTEANSALDKLDKTVNRRRKNIKLGDILRLSKRNMSYREIGLILGCTKQSIGFRLRKWEKSKLKENKH